MRPRVIFTGIFFFLTAFICLGQVQPGFFLDSWEPRVLVNPQYTEIQQTTQDATVAVTVDINDTVTKVSDYLFGDNANLWSGTMSDNAALMNHIADRQIGLLRGPGGSISDVFFWNLTAGTTPDSVPATLVGSTATNWPWYGHRPSNWDNSWTMDVDSFYSILGKVDATGMITVNYGYARYGTGKYPVRKAAHMAAEWVRYDNGRTKFWEIGNEVYGSWEAGYRIDRSQNLDGQPEYISGTLYGQHCNIFIDSMKAAAAETGVDIKIGVVMLDAYSSDFPYWNKQVATQAGDKADFYVIHSYYTPYNENSTVATILNSPATTGVMADYVRDQVSLAGKPERPVAMTEYNIFAVGSMQQVSHVNGMHAVLVTGEAMNQGYGAAVRWDLANGWSNGDDHGMFSNGDEPGVTKYAPRPAFYHMYYMRKYTGDVLINSSQVGSPGIVAIPSAFSSGQLCTVLVNKEKGQRVVRLNIKNFKVGERYYTYTLTGSPDTDFSRKVFVNGQGNTLVAGGPDDYETINALSSSIGDEIRVVVPALSVVIVIVEPGDKVLEINDIVSAHDGVADENDIIIYPNPSDGEFNIKNIPPDITAIEISDSSGRVIFRQTGRVSESVFEFNQRLTPGIYLVTLINDNGRITGKVIIR